MKLVKYGVCASLALLLCLVSVTPGMVESATSVKNEAKKVAVNGKTFAVNVVTVDVTDPTIQVVPTIAAGGIGQDEPFAAMVKREQALAAINGTFFNAYEKTDYIRYPNGTLYKSGELLHSGDNQTLIVNADKVPHIERVRAAVSVTVKRESGRDYKFQPWGVNKYYGADNIDQVVWYTPVFGQSIGFANGTKIVIRQGKVTQITEKSVAVPKDGFVLFVGSSGNNKTNLLPNVHVGDEVVTDLTAENSDSRKPVDIDQWLAAIGVGPKLVTNGKVDIDYERDGFNDPKISKQSAARSFVGVDGQKRLVMGTVGSATIAELAQIVLKLGLTEAMNMDGGASSGLYANGVMMTTPGRALSNALIVKKVAKPPVQIVINGRYMADFQGFIRNSTTMVPIRPLIEALKAEFEWNAEAGAVTVRHGDIELIMQKDKKAVTVNGEEQAVDEPLTIVDGRMYVPLRFIVEKLQAQLKWDPKLYRATIQIPE